MALYLRKKLDNKAEIAVWQVTETEEELMNFFDDLCTVGELSAMEQRYQVAVLLEQGCIYNEILEVTGASSATISRVNRSLQYGKEGYRVAFERLAAEKE